MKVLYYIDRFDHIQEVTDNIRPSFIDFMKTKYPHFNQLDSLEKLKIILNPDNEILPFANNSVFNLHFMKVSTENDINFGYEKITIVVDNIPLNKL
jgi:hypothetical protein